MGIKNFFVILASVLLASCSSLNKSSKSINEQSVVKPDNKIDELKPSQNSNIENLPSAAIEQQTQSPNNLNQYKIGLILGPGSIRSYAHIGVLQEIKKSKIPISHIVGMEFSAMIGAIYSMKDQPYDAEWQMFKLKEINSLSSFINQVFSHVKTEDFKISFSCPAYNLNKQQFFMMNRGAAVQMLPYCLSAAPLIKPYQLNVSPIMDLKSIVEYLKIKGVNYIIYVNILGSKSGTYTKKIDDLENIVWSLTAETLQKQSTLVDQVINVNVQDYDLLDFEKRRELLQKGIEAGQVGAAVTIKKLGL